MFDGGGFGRTVGLIETTNKFEGMFLRISLRSRIAFSRLEKETNRKENGLIRLLVFGAPFS